MDKAIAQGQAKKWLYATIEVKRKKKNTDLTKWTENILRKRSSHHAIAFALEHGV